MADAQAIGPVGDAARRHFACIASTNAQAPPSTGDAGPERVYAGGQ